MNYWFSEDKKIKLYNEDCLIVMQKLLDIGMKDKIDLIICDPPYRVTSRGNAGNSGGMLQDKINRQGIGCEIDENYYNIAIKRLKGESL